MPSTIRCFGRDYTLVTTRQQIFQRAGYRSQSVQSLEELERCLADYAVDLLVICHSTSMEECDEAKQLARRGRNAALVLVLTRHGEDRKSDANHPSFDTDLGPEKLLGTVTTLLQEHGLPGRPLP